MISSFMKQCVRVWHLLKKPARKEYLTTAKISAIGLAVIGVLGFVISMAIKFIQ